jgi:hypothetical protein
MVPDITLDYRHNATVMLPSIPLLFFVGFFRGMLGWGFGNDFTLASICHVSFFFLKKK